MASREESRDEAQREGGDPLQLSRIIAWLRILWIDMSRGEAVKLWSARVRDAPDLAEKELADIDRLLADPPNNIAEVLVANSWLTPGRLREARIRRRKPCATDVDDTDAMAWLHWMRAEFERILQQSRHDR